MVTRSLDINDFDKTFSVQIGSQMLDWVEAKYEVTKVSKLQGNVK